jgi:hypothetical protein
MLALQKLTGTGGSKHRPIAAQFTTERPNGSEVQRARSLHKDLHSGDFTHYCWRPGRAASPTRTPPAQKSDSALPIIASRNRC